MDTQTTTKCRVVLWLRGRRMVLSDAASSFYARAAEECSLKPEELIRQMLEAVPWGAARKLLSA